MKQKPTAFPNLLETMNGIADAHADIHSNIAGHAETHRDKMDAHRRALALKREADKLMKQGIET